MIEEILQELLKNYPRVVGGLEGCLATLQPNFTPTKSLNQAFSSTRYKVQLRDVFPFTSVFE